MLKKIKFLPLFIILLTGCNPDLIDYDVLAKPKISFMVDSLLVDLNTATLPEIVSVIKAEAGLINVKQYIIKSEDSETLYESPITSFNNETSYSISKLIPYTEDVVGYKIEAEDKGGRVVSSTLPVRVIPLRDAPTVTFLVNNVESSTVQYREGDPMPVIKINVISEDKLLNLAVSKVVSRSERAILVEGNDTIKFTNSEKSYTIDLSIDNYQFELKTTALKVYVAAGSESKPKIKVATLKVEFTEIPGPEVIFDGGSVKEVNEFTDVTISGSISAEAKIKNIKTYRKKSSGNILLEDIDLSPLQSPYSFSVLVNRILMDDEGVLIEATDGNNKTTSFTCDFNVTEVAPAPVVSITQVVDAFNGVDVDQILQLDGTITTSSEFKTVEFVVFDNTGAVTQRTPINYSGKTILINQAFDATKSTRKVGIEVVDINDKVMNVYRDVHVGYYYARILMSLAGEDDKKTSATGPLPGPFLSAKHLKAMSYIEGKAAPMDCDVAFHAQSEHGAIRCGNMEYVRTSPKFTGHTKTDAGLDTWGVSTNYTIKNVVNAFNRVDFDATTIDQITALTLEGGTESPVLASGPFPNVVPANVVIGYQTQIDGEAKTVIFVYDEFDRLTTDKSASTFYIKLKLQK